MSISDRSEEESQWKNVEEIATLMATDETNSVNAPGSARDSRYISEDEPSSTPKLRTPLFVYMLTFLSAIGGFLFGYDTGVIAGAIVMLEPSFSLSPLWREAIVSVPMASAAVFSLASDVTNTYFGRKITILVASTVFTIGSLLLAVSYTKVMLLLGRCILGIAIGLASSTVPMYLAECSPSDLRGQLVTLNSIFITGGQFIASLISGAFSYDHTNGWRYMFGLAAIPPLIQFIGFIFMPESPRWLVSKQKHDKARHVLQKIRGTSNVDHELADIQYNCRLHEHDSGEGIIVVKMLKSGPVRRALFLGCMLQLFQQLSGINTVMYYSATIIKMSGIGNTSSAIWLSSLSAGTNCLFTFVGLYLVDRVGRRPLTLGSLLGVLGSLLFLAAVFQLAAIHSPDVTIFENSTNSTSNQCLHYNVCNNCIMNSDCGFCYDVVNSDIQNGSCLPVAYLNNTDDRDYEHSAYGRCSSTSEEHWAYDFCPTRFAWLTTLGLVLYVAFFAPGMGPMPWTINAEIYPLWARSTGNSIATFVNWVSNLVIAMSFISLTEAITRYGAFYLYSALAAIGLLTFVICLPETKGLQLEEIEQVFSGPFAVFRHQRLPYEELNE